MPTSSGPWSTMTPALAPWPTKLRARQRPATWLGPSVAPRRQQARQEAAAGQGGSSGGAVRLPGRLGELRGQAERAWLLPAVGAAPRRACVPLLSTVSVFSLDTVPSCCLWRNLPAASLLSLGVGGLVLRTLPESDGLLHCQPSLGERWQGSSFFFVWGYMVGEGTSQP